MGKHREWEHTVVSNRWPLRWVSLRSRFEGSWTWWCALVIPGSGRQRQENLWGSVVSWVCLSGVLQASEKPHLLKVGGAWGMTPTNITWPLLTCTHQGACIKDLYQDKNEHPPLAQRLEVRELTGWGKSSSQYLGLSHAFPIKSKKSNCGWKGPRESKTRWGLRAWRILLGTVGVNWHSIKHSAESSPESQRPSYLSRHIARCLPWKRF